MKKRLYLFFLVFSCLFIGCGKKEENTDEKDEIVYAKNEVKKDSDEDEEEFDLEELVASSSNEETVEDKDGELLDTLTIDSINYTYPDNSNDYFYINDKKFATVMPFKFKLNNIVADDIDTVRDESVNHHIYCQGYSDTLNLTNLKNDASTKSLAILTTVAEKYHLGEYDFTNEDLFKSIDNFDELVKTCINYYTNKANNESATDIFDCAYKMEEGEFLHYTWKFSLNDEKLEYTDSDLQYLYKKLNIPESQPEIPTEENEESNIAPSLVTTTDFNSELVIDAYYMYNTREDIDSKVGTLTSYTVTLNRKPHFWNESSDTQQEVITKYYDLDGNELTKEEAELYNEDEIEVKEETISIGNMYSQNGYDFSNAYIKLKDDSYIGLNSFTFTIYNQKFYQKYKTDFLGY